MEHRIKGVIFTETRSKALNKLAQIKSTDGFSKNLTDHAVAHVYHGFDETISYSTFLTNVVKMQTFWSKKEVNRMLEKPTYNDDINALGFDTSLVRLSRDHLNILYWTFALLKALKPTFFTLKKQMVKLSEVQKCKSPLENFHMVST